MALCWSGSVTITKLSVSTSDWTVFWKKPRFVHAGSVRDAERHKHGERHRSRRGGVPHSGAEGKLTQHELVSLLIGGG